MRHQRRRGFCFALVLSVFAVGWSHSVKAEQVIRLNVPVDVTNLMPEVTNVRVICVIQEEDPQPSHAYIGYKYEDFAVNDGAFVQTVTMEITPTYNNNFSTAESYACHFVLVRDGPGNAPEVDHPSVGAATGGPADWNRADGSEPFTKMVHGSFSPEINQIFQGGNQSLSSGE